LKILGHLLFGLMGFVLFCLCSVSSTGRSVQVWVQTRAGYGHLASCCLQIGAAVSLHLKWANVPWECLSVHLPRSGRDPVNVRILRGGTMNCVGAGQ
jgi:hypothetical protein